MTSKFENFIDRRSPDEIKNYLATPTLFWYENVGRKARQRRKCIALAIDLDGRMLVAWATCSEKDQFVKRTGRAKAFGRLVGFAQNNMVILTTNEASPDGYANLYAEHFQVDRRSKGACRAFNAGKIYSDYVKKFQQSV